MTTQRKVFCKSIGCPHESQKKFSDWIRKELPNSCFGYYVTDIDFIIYNETTKRIMIIEQKINGKQISNYQSNILLNISKWISKGIDNTWTYLGHHVISFEKDSFSSGRVFFDGVERSEEKIKKYLSKI